MNAIEMALMIVVVLVCYARWRGGNFETVEYVHWDCA